MTFYRCLSGRGSRLILMLLIAFSVTSLIYGQGSRKALNLIIPGDSLSPSLSGHLLEILFQGVVNLYSMEDDNTAYYFIRDRNGTVFTLTVAKGKRLPKDEEASRMEGISNLLKLVMNDAPLLQKRIESLIPGKNEIVRLIHDYHVEVTGSSDGIFYELPPPAFVSRIGFHVSYNADFIRPGSRYDLQGFDLSPSYYPSAGVSYNSILPRISPRLLLTIDLSVGNRYVYGFYRPENPSLPVTDVFYELHMHNYLIMTDLLAGYTFRLGSIKSFASGGIGTRSVLSDNSRTDIDVCTGSVITSDTYNYDTGEKTSIGMVLSFGINLELVRTIPLTAVAKYNGYIVNSAYKRYNSVALTITATL